MVDILIAFALGVLTANVMFHESPPSNIYLLVTIKDNASQTTNDPQAAAGKPPESQESACQMETNVTSSTEGQDAEPSPPTIEWSEDFFKLEAESMDLLGPLPDVPPLSPVSILSDLGL